MKDISFFDQSPLRDASQFADARESFIGSIHIHLSQSKTDPVAITAPREIGSHCSVTAAEHALPIAPNVSTRFLR